VLPVFSPMILEPKLLACYSKICLRCVAPPEDTAVQQQSYVNEAVSSFNMKILSECTASKRELKY
jgi:hypothetical protein